MVEMEEIIMSQLKMVLIQVHGPMYLMMAMAILEDGVKVAERLVEAVVMEVMEVVHLVVEGVMVVMEVVHGVAVEVMVEMVDHMVEVEVMEK